MTLSAARVATTSIPAWACVCVALAMGSTRAFQGSQTPPPASAAPAAKDAFVERQLAMLFAGAPVRVTIRRDAIRAPFESGASGESVLVVVSRAGASAAERDFSLGLFDYGDVATARRTLQEGLRSLTSPLAAPKAGYDEFYVATEGRMLGRYGSLVVHVYSSSAGASDSALTALAKNIAANRTLLSDLVKYAATMHFGDAAPVKVALANLKARVPELLTFTVNESRSGDPSRANEIEANYTIAGGGHIRIIGKAYDSDASAKAALGREMGMVSVGPDVTKPVRGGTLYEYTCCSGFRLHAGAQTFDVHSFSMPPVPWAIMRKVSSALVEVAVPTR